MYLFTVAYYNTLTNFQVLNIDILVSLDKKKNYFFVFSCKKTVIHKTNQ